MLVKLNDIPDSGKDFDFTQKNDEMRQALYNLTKDQPFSIQVRLTPTGSAYDLRGKYQILVPSTCSRCASKFVADSQNKIFEILMVREKAHMDVKSEQEFQIGQAEITQLNEPIFDIVESLRQIIELSQPYTPLCSDSCKGLCTVCGKNWNEGSCGCKIESTQKKSPFDVLKNLDLKKH